MKCRNIDVHDYDLSRSKSIAEYAFVFPNDLLCLVLKLYELIIVVQAVFRWIMRKLAGVLRLVSVQKTNLLSGFNRETVFNF